MRIEYPAVIERSAEYPSEARVHFPDFGDAGDDVIEWGRPEEMKKRAAFSLGSAYALATCFGDEPPAPSTVKATVTPRKVACMVTCNYDLFRELCLTERVITL